MKFPADRLEDVLINVRKLVEREDELREQVAEARSASEVRAAFDGEEYGADERT